MKYSPGDTILIKINGKEVLTTIDEQRVQRLPCDPLIDKLFHADLLDLNKLTLISLGYSIDRKPEFSGTFTAEDRFELYRDRLGYSVSGFWEVYPDADIENPLWNKEKEAI